jgi:hypothetical protein
MLAKVGGTRVTVFVTVCVIGGWVIVVVRVVVNVCGAGVTPGATVVVTVLVSVAVTVLVMGSSVLVIVSVLVKVVVSGTTDAAPAKYPPTPATIPNTTAVIA